MGFVSVRARRSTTVFRFLSVSSAFLALTPVLALGLLLGSSSGRILAQEAADDAASDAPTAEDGHEVISEACRACSGSGEKTCTRCSGSKVLETACEECAGAGQSPCAKGCVEGRLPCPTCGGSGKRATKSGGRPTGKFIRCSRCSAKGTIKCTRYGCRGGFKRCKECKGKKVFTHDCDNCSGSGALSCEPCKGKGTIDVVMHRQPSGIPVESPVAARTTFVETLKGVLDLYAKARDRAESRATDWETIETAYTSLEASVRETRALKLWTDTQRKRRESLVKSWTQCRESVNEASDLFVDVERLIGKADSRVRSVKKLITEVEASEDTPGTTAQRARDREVQFFTSLNARSHSLGTRIESVRVTLESMTGSVQRFRKAYRKDVDERDAEAARKKALEASFKAFERSVPAVAKKAGLPKARVQLVENVSEPDALVVDVSYRDAEAEPATSEDEATMPTDDLLERIPAFLTAAFESTDAVKTISVRVRGRRLSSTGVMKAVTIQKFTAPRDEWDELRVGVFKDDWVELLSRIRPNPEFPRPGYLSDEGMSTSVLMVVVVALGLALVVVARMAMLRS